MIKKEYYMKRKEFTTIRIDGEDFNIKSSLSLSEITLLVQETMRVYAEGLVNAEGKFDTDNIIGLDGNPISADFAFNVVLTSLVSQELSQIDYDILYSHRAYEVILEEVVGAKEAKQYVIDAIKRINSLENVLMKSVTTLAEKLPDAKDLQKLSKSLIKDLTNPKNADAINKLKDVLVLNKEIQ